MQWLKKLISSKVSFAVKVHTENAVSYRSFLMFDFGTFLRDSLNCIAKTISEEMSEQKKEIIQVNDDIQQINLQNSKIEILKCD